MPYSDLISSTPALKCLSSEFLSFLVVTLPPKRWPSPRVCLSPHQPESTQDEGKIPRNMFGIMLLGLLPCSTCWILYLRKVWWNSLPRSELTGRQPHQVPYGPLRVNDHTWSRASEIGVHFSKTQFKCHLTPKAHLENLRYGSCINPPPPGRTWDECTESLWRDALKNAQTGYNYFLVTIFRDLGQSNLCFEWTSAPSSVKQSQNRYLKGT